MKKVIAFLILGPCWVCSSAMAEPPTIKVLHNTSDSVALQVTGLRDTGYRIDVSSDLVFWSYLFSSNAAGGEFLVTDRKAATGHRFYRAAETREIVGQSRALGMGNVRSWVRLDTNGLTEAIGVTLTEGALTNMPSGSTELTLVLPSAVPAAPFDHIGLNWNPQGHPPSGVYNRPHFDVHFYIISMEERNAISAGNTSRMYAYPDAAFLPPDYDLSPGSGDVRMGSHWWDLTAPELNGEMFTHSLLYGYYDGRMTFIEPMVTLAFLQQRIETTAAVKQPAAFLKAGRYPARYGISHSPEFMEYSIWLDHVAEQPGSVMPARTRTAINQAVMLNPSVEAWCSPQALTRTDPVELR